MFIYKCVPCACVKLLPYLGWAPSRCAVVVWMLGNGVCVPLACVFCQRERGRENNLGGLLKASVCVYTHYGVGMYTICCSLPPSLPFLIAPISLPLSISLPPFLSFPPFLSPSLSLSLSLSLPSSLFPFLSPPLQIEVNVSLPGGDSRDRSFTVSSSLLLLLPPPPSSSSSSSSSPLLLLLLPSPPMAL